MNNAMTNPNQVPLKTTISVDDTKRRIDAYLDSLMGERIAQAEALSDEYASLWKAIAHLSASGGKRMRPYVMLLSYAMNESDFDIDSVLAAAASLELLHVAVLIHDDIIDRDYVRYGVKNISGQYSDLYRPYISSNKDLQHFSDSAALLAGDLLIAEAYRSLQSCVVDAECKAGAQAVLSESIFRVVGGELLDTESVFRQSRTIHPLAIAEQKTASYSFVSPLVLGATLAGGSAETVQRLTEFGKALGIAYQLQDDLLGTYGDEKITGKSTSSDITEGKRTFLIEQFYRLATPAQIESFEAVFQNHLASESDVEMARNLLTATGSRSAVESKIQEYADTARSVLDRMDMTDEYRSALNSLIMLCTSRIK